MKSLIPARPALAELPIDLLTNRYMNSWAKNLNNKPGIQSHQLQTIRNYIEAVGRLIKKRGQVERGCGIGKPDLTFDPNEEAQSMVYDLYEGYFQSVYKNLSTLAAVTAAFPVAFGNLPVRSMKKFLEAVSTIFPHTQSACEALELARKFRTLLDHPAGAQVSNWMTYHQPDGRGLTIIHFGNAGATGNIPEGAVKITWHFPLEADWVFDLPDILIIDGALRELTEVIFSKLSVTELLN